MGVVLHYLRLAVVPAPLVLDYGWPKATSIGEIAGPAIVVAALVVATILLIVKRRPLGFLSAWILLILAPTSSVLPIVTEIAAEHRMYLPVAAVIAFAVLGVCRLLARAGVSTARASTLVAAAALVVAGVFATLTRDRNRDYWSDEGLWAKTVAQRPENGRAHLHLAIDLLASQRTAEAERHLREAVRLSPDDATSHLDLGLALYLRRQPGGRHRRARGRPVRSIPRPVKPPARSARPISRRIGPSRPWGLFEHALDLLPDGRASRYLMTRVAWLLATSPDDAVRDGAKAVTLAERAVALTSRRDASALDALGAVYAETGRFGRPPKRSRRRSEWPKTNTRPICCQVSGNVSRCIGAVEKFAVQAQFDPKLSVCGCQAQSDPSVTGTRSSSIGLKRPKRDVTRLTYRTPRPYAQPNTRGW